MCHYRTHPEYYFQYIPAINVPFFKLVKLTKSSKLKNSEIFDIFAIEDEKKFKNQQICV